MFWYMDFIFTSFKDPSVCGLNFEINSTNAKQTKIRYCVNSERAC